MGVSRTMVSIAVALFRATRAIAKITETQEKLNKMLVYVDNTQVDAVNAAMTQIASDVKAASASFASLVARIAAAQTAVADPAAQAELAAILQAAQATDSQLQGLNQTIGATAPVQPAPTGGGAPTP